jgi:hypothetical protein
MDFINFNSSTWMECNKKQNGSLEERDEVVSQNLEI